jgi:hypothetical protein
MATDAFGVYKILPDLSGGIQWYSTAWATGGKRTIKGAGTNGRAADPKDKYMFFHAVKTDGNKVTIDGTSGSPIAHMSGKNPRIYVNDLWKNSTKRKFKNVECTAFAKMAKVNIGDGSYTTFRLNSRTNHHATAKCKRNAKGYGAEMFVVQNTLKPKDGRFRKELAHPHYANSKIANIPTTFDWKNNFLGMKFIVYNNKDGNVACKMYLNVTGGAGGSAGNWTLKQTLIDTGTNWAITDQKELNGIQNDINSGKDCIDAKPPGPPYREKVTRAGYSSYIRTDWAGDVQVKWASFREIIPPD